jgi:uncharacterized phage protein (TIGR02218 family)
MSYNAIERSIEISPVELFKFYDTDGTIKTYNSGVEDITYLSEVYKPEKIDSDAIELTDESEAKTLTVRVPRKSSIAGLFLVYAPIEQIWLSIYRKHWNDEDAEYVAYWTGMVSGVEYTADYANLICKPVDTAFNKLGLWRNYASKCQHMLYDIRCKVNISLPQYSQTVTLSSVNNGIYLESNDFGVWKNFINPIAGDSKVYSGWWATGFIRVPSTGEVRMITIHGAEGGDGYVDNTKVTILSAINGLKAGDIVEVYAGCARDLDTCLNKFNNTINFGGFPYIPLNNPFTYKITT